MQSPRIPHGAWFPPFVLGTFVVVFLFDVLFLGRTFFMRDTFAGIIPHWSVIARIVQSGALPLWNPLNACGTPLMGDPYISAFYLPNWMFVFGPLETALHLWWAFHLLVACLSCHALLRRWRCAPVSALIGAVGFGFGTWTVSWLEFGPSLAAWALAPLVLLAIHGILHNEHPCAANMFIFVKRRAVWVAVLGLISAQQLCATAEWFFYSAILALAYGLWTALTTQNRATAFAGLFLVAAGFLLGLALASPQILLGRDLLADSVRAEKMDAGLDMASAHPFHWLQYFAAFIFGGPGYPDKYWAPSVYEFVNGTSSAGAFVLLLAFLGVSGLVQSRVRAERGGLIFFAAAMTAFSLLMAGGKYFSLYPLLHDNLPVFKQLRFATKFLAFAALFIPVLAAFGVDLVLAADKLTRKTRFALLGFAWTPVFLGFLLCLRVFASDGRDFLGIPLTFSLRRLDEARADVVFAALLALSGAVWVSVVVWRRRCGLVLGLAGIVLAFVPLALVSRKCHPVLDAGIYGHNALSLKEVIAPGSRLRAFAPATFVQQWLYGKDNREIIHWAEECGVGSRWNLYGIAEVRPAGLPSKRHAVLYQALQTPDTVVQNRAADLLSVAYVVRPTAPLEQVLFGGGSREIQILHRASALPRFFLRGDWKIAANDDAVLSALFASEFNPATQAVVLSEGGEPPLPPPTLLSAPDSTLEIAEIADRWSTISLRVKTDAPALLVFNDTWHQNWRVQVNDTPCPIYRANFLFQSVFVPAGESVVMFTYWPRVLNLALTLVGSSLCAVCALLCLGLSDRMLAVRKRSASTAR